MKMVTCFFTRTGNSRVAAKKIASVLEDTGLVPIASLKNPQGRAVPAADRVGTVCPGYGAGAFP